MNCSGVIQFRKPGLRERQNKQQFVEMVFNQNNVDSSTDRERETKSIVRVYKFILCHITVKEIFHHHTYT